MNIQATQYSIAGKYLEIFITGCKGINKCRRQCHNSTLWDFEAGTNADDYIDLICAKILDNISLIKMLIITGGEPLDQDEFELIKLIKTLKVFKLPIVLFTSYKFNKVPKSIKEIVDMIKCGPYDESKNDIKDVFYFNLQSTNQILYRKEPNGEWSCI